MSKTLFIGAGGGGDTICAALRAAYHNRGAVALGAGYTPDKYISTLTKIAMDRSNDRLVRIGCTLDEAVSHLDLVFGTQHALDASSVKRIQKTRAPSPIASHIIEHEAGALYCTLHEEFEFVNGALCADTPVFMWPSVTDMRSPDAARAAEELEAFITLHDFDEISIMDFGGDITEPGPPRQRDTCTLSIVQDIVRRMNAAAGCNWVRLFVEVYGPGCDGHKFSRDVVDRVRSMGLPNLPDTLDDNTVSAQLYVPTELDNFAGYLRCLRHHPCLARSVMLPGRAVANFLDASPDNLGLRREADDDLVAMYQNDPDARTLLGTTFEIRIL